MRPRNLSRRAGADETADSEKLHAHGPGCLHLNEASTRALDWSGQLVPGITPEGLDPREIASARTRLRSRNPESELLKMSDDSILRGIEAVRGDSITNVGHLLF